MRSYKIFKENKKVGNFGIQYLDDKLKGILKSDLILIGARSGAGKSTIANMVAKANKDKKVALLSLENFEGDLFINDVYYRYMDKTRNYDYDMRAFISGQYQLDDEVLRQCELEAEKATTFAKNVYRQDDYGIKKIKEDIIRSAEAGIELIIIDHLDYIDKDNPNENDNSHITELMKTIRQAQDIFKVAVIAVSHLRKSNGKEPPVVPNMDEFIGSSNKVKQSTAVIMIAPDDSSNENAVVDHLKATWCCVRKLRNGGIDNKTARLYFNKKTGSYEQKYDICKVNYSGTEVEEIL